MSRKANRKKRKRKKRWTLWVMLLVILMSRSKGKKRKICKIPWDRCSLWTLWAQSSSLPVKMEKLFFSFSLQRKSKDRRRDLFAEIKKKGTRREFSNNTQPQTFVQKKKKVKFHVKMSICEKKKLVIYSRITIVYLAIN